MYVGCLGGRVTLDWLTVAVPACALMFTYGVAYVHGSWNGPRPKRTVQPKHASPVAVRHGTKWWRIGDTIYQESVTRYGTTKDVWLLFHPVDQYGIACGDSVSVGADCRPDGSYFVRYPDPGSVRDVLAQAWCDEQNVKLRGTLEAPPPLPVESALTLANQGGELTQPHRMLTIRDEHA